MQKRAGYREALTLTAGEVASLLRESRIKPILRGEELPEIHFFERVYEFVVGSIRASHEQVVPNRPGEDIAVEIDGGYVIHERFFVDVSYLNAVYLYAPFVAFCCAADKRSYCALSAAGLADDGHQAVPRNVRRDAVEHRLFPVIGEGHVFEPYIAVKACGNLRSALVLGSIENLEKLVARRHTVHRNMEERAEQAQGQEEIRGKHNDKKRLRQCYHSVCRLKYRDNNAGGAARICDDIHDADGVQLHGKHLHGDTPELLRLFVHLNVLSLIGLIYLEGRESLNILKERVAEIDIYSPVFAQQPFCYLLHRDYRKRNQRHADEKHERGFPADKREHRKKRYRRKHGKEELRQIFSEIKLKLIDTLDKTWSTSEVETFS